VKALRRLAPTLCHVLAVLSYQSVSAEPVESRAMEPLEPLDEVTRMQLRAAADSHICPSCGTEIDASQATGSGALDDGLFCSLTCFSRFHEKRIAERHVRTKHHKNGDD
jgi:uncharacterized protein (UPF0212 family)